MLVNIFVYFITYLNFFGHFIILRQLALSIVLSPQGDEVLASIFWTKIMNLLMKKSDEDSSDS